MRVGVLLAPLLPLFLVEAEGRFLFLVVLLLDGDVVFLGMGV